MSFAIPPKFDDQVWFAWLLVIIVSAYASVCLALGMPVQPLNVPFLNISLDHLLRSAFTRSAGTRTSDDAWLHHSGDSGEYPMTHADASEH